MSYLIPPEADAPKWYALGIRHTRSLEAVAELRALGYGAYVPCETVIRRKGRRMVHMHRPAWPGYVFVSCETSAFRDVLEVDGVHDFIRTDGKPVKLWTNALVPIVLAEMFGDLDYTRQPQAYRAERGDHVRVRSGKWKGYLGRVLSVSKRKAIMELEKGVGKLTVDADALEMAA